MIFAGIIFAVVWAVYLIFYFTPLCPIIRSIKTREKIVALTFDDGPNPPFTNQIIDILNLYRIKATFFMTGQNVEERFDIVSNVQAAGHSIGNHSFSHSKLVFRSTKFIQNEIIRTDTLLRKAGVKSEIYFRSPHGLQFFQLCRMLKSMHRKNILFNVIAWDWKIQNPKMIAFLVVLLTRPGSIIVLHDGGGNRTATIQALPVIISKLENRGYKFVKLDKLLTTK